MNKAFSLACENNKHSILAVLKHYLTQVGSLLEIGSGTGQHAVFFSQQLPHVTWQTSDLVENHGSIQAWIDDYEGRNCLPPLVLDVDAATAGLDPLSSQYHWVYSANTAHIMSWHQTQKMIALAASKLPSKGFFFLYGPFNYKGQFTSDSNARFNDWLQSQAPHRAIRDFESVVACAQQNGLVCIADHDMPANNRCLVFKKH